MTAPRRKGAVRPGYRLHRLRAGAVELSASPVDDRGKNQGETRGEARGDDQDDDLFLDSDWSPAAVGQILEAPGCFALAARAGARAVGLILGRAVARECEILWLAVAPAHRRRGIARRLLRAALNLAARRGVETVYLEVAVTNAAARALYEGAGFQCCGRRPGYYQDRPAGGAGDALVLKTALASAEERRPPRRENGMKKAQAQAR